VIALSKRSTVKLPVAPANRPVPPVMVYFSTMLKKSGPDVTPCPTTSAKMLSPLAATM